MPLVPSSSATPTHKEKGTQFPENAGSSWSRLWIAQHPPKAAKAEVTLHPPSLVAAEEKYPPLSDIDHIAPLHQILPLYPLPSIDELPKQESLLEAKAASPSTPTQDSQEPKMSTTQRSRRASVSSNANFKDASNGNLQEIEEILRGMNILPLPSVAEAAGVPLPPVPSNSDLKKASSGNLQEDEEITRGMNIFPLPSIAEAAGVPLPSSPTSEGISEPSGLDTDQQSSPLQGPEGVVPKDEAVEQSGKTSGEDNATWTSRLNSMLPNAMTNRPSRQSTGLTNTRASRAASVAPGAYPESDSTEESLKQHQGEPNAITDQPIRQSTDLTDTRASRASSVASGARADSDTIEKSPKQHQEEPVEHTRPKIDQPQPDEKSVRPRKSVSIVLPGTSNELKTRQEEHKDGGRSSDERSDNVSPSGSQDTIDSEAEAKLGPKGDAPGKSSTASEADEVAADPRTSREQAGPDTSPKFLQAPNQRDASVNSRTNSIAASHSGTDRSDLSTLHEQESLAPSDADNSSLMPLLPSSPGDAHSSHFTESLDENRETSVMENPLKDDEKSQKEAVDPPLSVDDSSSVSTTDSPTSSKTAKPHQKKARNSSFSPADNGEGPSNAAFSLPPPKIVVKHATSAEESSQTPPLVAPTTTPEQDDPTPPRRQTTFAALGEPSDDERAIKLPVKGRKLYVRKVRYAVLRQPILNAVLGRQVGPKTKKALKKLANGELIVDEPAGSP